MKNINAFVKSGELLVIIGPVGSGKSSLLMTLLEELPLTSGNIQVKGKMSYSPQEAWTFVATIRENILFGSEFNQQKYDQVIKVCALERDMELLPYGDQTIVGEKGVSLSGGQRTRITLARSIYNDADIYLLDDPLSAVDTHVAKHIFQKCLLQHLKSKVRILVTHQLQYLPNADKVLILKDSEAIAYGTYEELKNKGINFSTFVTDGNKSKPGKIKKETSRNRAMSWTSIASSESEFSTQQLDTIEPIEEEEESEEQIKIKQKKIEKQIEDAPKMNTETKQTGSIAGRIYWEYIKASRSPFTGLVACISMVISQIFLQLSDIWVTEW